MGANFEKPCLQAMVNQSGKASFEMPFLGENFTAVIRREYPKTFKFRKETFTITSYSVDFVKMVIKGTVARL